MRIILSMSSYLNLTGSEIYNYDLAKELSLRGHSITILANQIGGEIAKKTKKNLKNVEIYPFFDHPELPAELVISSQPLPTTYSLRFFNSKETCHFQVIHSLFNYEEPINAKEIKQYIAVRPEIKKHWSEKYPQIADRVAVIWNGVDTKRFHDEDTKPHDKKRVLFVGTMDQLRKNVIEELMQEAASGKIDLILCLSENPFQNVKNIPKNIRFCGPRWNIEHLIAECDETAGIFVGRTTIEGFMMNKPAFVYDVDFYGNILQRASYTVPENRHIFDITYMTDQMLQAFNEHRYD